MWFNFFRYFSSLTPAERNLTLLLLQQRFFTKMVDRVHAVVYRAKHGVFPEDMGGTTKDSRLPQFIKYFWEEVRGQAGRGPPGGTGSKSGLDQGTKPPKRR